MGEVRNDGILALTGDYEPVVRMLDKLGIERLTVRRSDILPEPVAAHADMLVFCDGGSNVLTYDAFLTAELNARGFSCAVPETPLLRDYPGCIRLNCLLMHGTLLANTAHCAGEVLELAESLGAEIVNVRQGYVKCSTAVVSDSAAITADSGIASALEQRGVEVMRISPGGIRLDGYDYGFIGGCCARVRDMMLFAGDPLSHPDGESIVRFVETHGLRVVTTDGGMLTDFGGVILL